MTYAIRKCNLPILRSSEKLMEEINVSSNFQLHPQSRDLEGNHSQSNKEEISQFEGKQNIVVKDLGLLYKCLLRKEAEIQRLRRRNTGALDKNDTNYEYLLKDRDLKIVRLTELMGPLRQKVKEHDEVVKQLDIMKSEKKALMEVNEEIVSEIAALNARHLQTVAEKDEKIATLKEKTVKVIEEAKNAVNAHASMMNDREMPEHSKKLVESGRKMIEEGKKKLEQEKAIIDNEKRIIDEKWGDIVRRKKEISDAETEFQVKIKELTAENDKFKQEHNELSNYLVRIETEVKKFKRDLDLAKKEESINQLHKELDEKSQFIESISDDFARKESSFKTNEGKLKEEIYLKDGMIEDLEYKVRQQKLSLTVQRNDFDLEIERLKKQVEDLNSKKRKRVDNKTPIMPKKTRTADQNLVECNVEDSESGSNENLVSSTTSTDENTNLSINVEPLVDGSQVYIGKSSNRVDTIEVNLEEIAVEMENNNANTLIIADIDNLNGLEVVYLNNETAANLPVSETTISPVADPINEGSSKSLELQKGNSLSKRNSENSSSESNKEEADELIRQVNDIIGQKEVSSYQEDVSRNVEGTSGEAEQINHEELSSNEDPSPVDTLEGLSTTTTEELDVQESISSTQPILKVKDMSSICRPEDESDVLIPLETTGDLDIVDVDDDPLKESMDEDSIKLKSDINDLVKLSLGKFYLLEDGIQTKEDLESLTLDFSKRFSDDVFTECQDKKVTPNSKVLTRDFKRSFVDQIVFYFEVRKSVNFNLKKHNIHPLTPKFVSLSSELSNHFYGDILDSHRAMFNSLTDVTLTPDNHQYIGNNISFKLSENSL